MESREGGGGRGRQEEGGDRLSLLLSPHPAPGSAPASSTGRFSGPRAEPGRSPGGDRREAGPPPGSGPAPAGLGPVLTAASHSDAAAAAAAAAGATLPPPPGRGRGADPQRHLGRCTLLRRPRAPLHSTPPFLTSSLLSRRPYVASRPGSPVSSAPLYYS